MAHKGLDCVGLKVVHKNRRMHRLIGMYAPRINPFIDLGEKGVQDYVAAAALRDVTPLFFDSTGIDFESRTILGLLFQNGFWEMVTYPFPQSL